VSLCVFRAPLVPEQVNIAYGATKLNFGRDYIIPKPFDPRLPLLLQLLQKLRWILV
jgi:malate dehydrogenase (oxaloacetate-decarboxylating)(NADP+)